MKLRIAHVVVFGLLAVTTGNRQASASTISFEDTFDPADRLMFGQGTNALCTGINATDTITQSDSCQSLTWTHTLQGFNSATDSLTSASAVVTVYNGALDSQSEDFDIFFDLLSFKNNAVLDTSTVNAPHSFPFTVGLLNQLSDGQLLVTLTSANGNHDFYFAKSVLSAESSTRVAGAPLQATPVPEPATLGLLGLGLVGIASKARARLRRS